MGVPPPPAQRRPIETIDDVGLLVRRFYQAVIPDPLLGPIFHGMAVDWSVHIPKLIDFWSARLLDVTGYEGNPVGAHQPVLERYPFGPAELEQWLTLWDETVDELFVGDVADLAKQRARTAAAAIGSLARRHSQLCLSGTNVRGAIEGVHGGEKAVAIEEEHVDGVHLQA
jgi:hemoglobin